MRPTLIAATGLLIAASLAGLAFAKPLTYALPDETAVLRPGPEPGFETAKNNCMVCHSVDYIQTQPPKKGAAFWEAEVTKMIKVYKAQIDEKDARAIADYLAQTY